MGTMPGSLPGSLPSPAPHPQVPKPVWPVDDSPLAGPHQVRTLPLRTACDIYAPQETRVEPDNTGLERKRVFQRSMFMFHVNLPGCKFVGRDHIQYNIYIYCIYIYTVYRLKRLEFELFGGNA